ncbi:Acetyltransferase (GNAT) family protein [Caballeronia choica]|uniref:Acetyltransferase (GNAT) family protein n=1 Tax=Caballeronia choica TaxID=326476 RepID=A0A158KI83_9BURK|nr:GNAT family N-acetyltransferase [Caballeronia choica]SAL80842.1 Acetyltransferase (GNAT) family protein [Caballeronia choica]
MSNAEIKFRLVNSYSDVRAYLSDIVQAADSAKDALGFFAKPIFEEYARKDLIFVLLIADGNSEIYGGHLIFDARFPKAKVRQIFVVDRFRRLKLGNTLVDALKEQLTEFQFISISARVAEDLRDANHFWERQGFYTQQLVKGGESRKRIIVVRAHELATPQLFQSSGITAADPLGLDFKQDQERPLFLLDLNVLFDLGPRRPRHEQAVAVFRAERMQACSLAISSEIEAELKRTAQKGKTDPMQALAHALPRFTSPEGQDWDRLAPELCQLVFPERALDGRLTANDLSDLKHLATAIHHRLPGLVTSDASVVRCARELRRRYGIEVVSPEAFQAGYIDHPLQQIHATSTGDVLSIQVAQDSDEKEIKALLTELDVNVADQAAHWAAVDGSRGTSWRFMVKDEKCIVGYIAWSRTIHDGPFNAHIAVDEANDTAGDAVRLMLQSLIGVISPSAVARIRLRFPKCQVVVREVAATLGFTRLLSDTNELQKVMVSSIVSKGNWMLTRDSLSNASSIVLPAASPHFRHVDQQIPVIRPDGERVHISLFTLETHLAPALFCLPGRGGVLVPVQRKFAEHLLLQSPQASLLPQARAQLLSQRHYLSGPATLKVFTRGDLIFFYESEKDGGAGAVIALARTLRAYRRSEDALGGTDLLPSVLDSDSLASIGRAAVKTVTAFDNLLELPRQVSRADLRELGCGEAHQLLTSRRLTAQQVEAILRKGTQ